MKVELIIAINFKEQEKVDGAFGKDREHEQRWNYILNLEMIIIKFLEPYTLNM